MQKSFRLLAAATLTLFAAACSQPSGQGGTAASSGNAGDLTTDAQKFGYAIGTDLGKSLKQVNTEVDLDSLKLGLDEAMAGKAPRMDDKARQEIKTTIAKKIQSKQKEERDAKATKNKEAGEKFLAENAKKEGVKTTASGLQYEVITEGKGDHPTKDDKVTVNYRGTLLDGTEFDSSYSRNQPITFPLANVIPGWTEGVQLMTAGSKYKFYIPSNLAYGERGAGAKIGPNETLIFEVELISFEKGGGKAESDKPAAGGKPSKKITIKPEATPKAKNEGDETKKE
ncbi:MAG TPA: FKBP-type peptidyl-prolyl cis-trans isomerase [Nevskiaceae bacterium]|nr:FKBP-type peptidyl-prolyl cis-trans isomerase [Nevskiaceae bacterium]